ncbi:unnamed protein product, partial [Ectocarpus sp. 13 AM-2016]
LFLWQTSCPPSTCSGPRGPSSPPEKAPRHPRLCLRLRLRRRRRPHRLHHASFPAAGRKKPRPRQTTPPSSRRHRPCTCPRQQCSGYICCTRRGRTPPRCRRTRPGGTSAPSPPRAVGGRTRTRQRCRRRSRRTGRSSSGDRRSARPTRRYRR